MDIKAKYFESLYSSYGQYFDIENVVYQESSQFWDLIIFENAKFGKVLALNGVIQTTECDEFIYHEMITHVPILAHGNVQNVLIIGGGDGGALREVVKYQHIDSITMIEIDAKIVDIAKKYFPKHSQDAFDDSRLKLKYMDGATFVEQTSEQFDVIISDCTDPIGSGRALFESEFYKNCKKRLKKNGIFVAQNGVPLLQAKELQDTVRRLGQYVQDVSFYSAAIPTYIGGAMMFAWGTDNITARHKTVKQIENRYKEAKIRTRFYTPQLHVASFALPAYVEVGIAIAMADVSK